MESLTKLKELQRKFTGVQRSKLFTNCMWMLEWEKDYLLSGHATEFVDLEHIYTSSGEEIFVKIYGVVRAKREYGKYVWVYLYCDNRLWKCNSLRHAYELVDKLKNYTKLKSEVYKLRSKLYND